MIRIDVDGPVEHSELLSSSSDLALMGFAKRLGPGRNEMKDLRVVFHVQIVSG